MGLVFPAVCWSVDQHSRPSFTKMSTGHEKVINEEIHSQKDMDFLTHVDVVREDPSSFKDA